MITLQHGPGSSCWHTSFEVPDETKFSSSVQEAIQSGVIPTKARRELTQTLRTLMVQHTHQPTSEQYTTVCQKLVVKFPKLRDVIGYNGYVSQGYINLWWGIIIALYF